MKLLLDTHILLWWLSDSQRLRRETSEQIATRTNHVYVSAVSLWEIVVKTRTKKLTADIASIERVLGTSGFERLGISSAHLATLATLPVHHRDPFDHLLIAQAISEDATFVSDDQIVGLYPVSGVGLKRVQERTSHHRQSFRGAKGEPGTGELQRGTGAQRVTSCNEAHRFRVRLWRPGMTAVAACLDAPSR